MSRSTHTAFVCFFLPFAFVFPIFVSFFLAGRVFAQPVTLTGVVSWISAPFWPMNAVGIVSDPATVCLTLRVTVCLWPLTLTVTFFLTVTVFVSEQRFPFAARAEYLPSGNVISKLVTGWSGTVWNVLTGDP